MVGLGRGWSYVGTTPGIIGSREPEHSGAGGLYLLRASPVAASAEDTPPLAASDPDLESVSYLACASGPRPHLYVASSRATGGEGVRDRISAWNVDPATGALTGRGAIESQGAGISHLALSATGRYLLTANYGRGSVSAYSLLTDGNVGPLTSEVVHESEGPGPVAARQDAPHPHMVAVDPQSGAVLVPDLGADRVFTHGFDEGRGTLNAQPDRTVVLPPGSGPRHLAVLRGRGLAVVANELAGTVALLVRDREGRYALRDIVPSTSRRDVTNAPSGVRASEDGGLVYVANRGPNSISVFRTDGSRLEAVQEVTCGGDWPRDLLIDLQNGVVLVANHRSHEVTALRLATSGLLEGPAGRWRVRCPNCVVNTRVDLV